jgi:predicted GIY-YIG superfamily endonuclease
LKSGKYTRLSRTEKLVYYERYIRKEEALRRERQIKGWRREKKENLIKHGSPKKPAYLSWLEHSFFTPTPKFSAV